MAASGIFLAGVAVFTLASLGCGLAGGAGWLVAARAVQGAAASVLTPGAMSLIAQAYPKPARRAQIIGLWQRGEPRVRARPAGT